MTDHELLGVASTASDEELREAFLFLAKKFHPDANPGQEKQAAEHFKNVEAAYFRIRTKPKRQAEASPPVQAAPPGPPNKTSNPARAGNGQAIGALFLFFGIVGAAMLFMGRGSSASQTTAPPANHRPSTQPLAWKSWLKFTIVGENYVNVPYSSPDLVLKADLENTTLSDIEAATFDVVFTDMFGSPVMVKTFTWDESTIRAGLKVAGTWRVHDVPAEFKNAGRTRSRAEVTRIALKDGTLFSD